MTQFRQAVKKKVGAFQVHIVLVLVLFFIAFFAAGVAFSQADIDPGEPTIAATDLLTAAGEDIKGTFAFPAAAQDLEIAQCLNNYMANKVPNSPLKDRGAKFTSAGRNKNVNPALMVSIGYHESVLGTEGIAVKEASQAGIADGDNHKNTQSVVLTHNYYGLTSVKSDLHVHKEDNASTITDIEKISTRWRTFTSWENAITYQSEYLRENYLDDGRNSISLIASKYAPVGAGNDPNGLNANWVKGVTNSFKEIISACPDLNYQVQVITPSEIGNPVFVGDSALPIDDSLLGNALGQKFNTSLHKCSISRPEGCGIPGHRVMLGSLDDYNVSWAKRVGEGVDLAAPGKTPVYAPFDGKIVFSSVEGALGATGGFIVILSTDQKSVALLAHIQNYLALNTQVTAGQKVGELKEYEGDLGPHLHFELWVEFLPINAGTGGVTPQEIWEAQKQALGRL